MQECQSFFNFRKSIVFAVFLCDNNYNGRTHVRTWEEKNMKKYEIFVATNGNDQNDGSIEHPLASLEAAKRKARTLRGRGEIGSEQREDGKVHTGPALEKVRTIWQNALTLPCKLVGGC